MNAQTKSREQTCYTPGLWFNFGDRVTRQDGRCIVDCGNCSIAIPPGEREANARLIAAATDLLEACKAVVGGIPQGEPGHVDLFEAFKKCEAAIAKAEGKQ